jgi:hypothetical protein
MNEQPKFKVGDKVYVRPLTDYTDPDYDFEVDRERPTDTIWTISEVYRDEKADLRTRQVRSRWVLLKRLVHVPVVDLLGDTVRFHATEEDVGRSVVYTPYEGAKTEDGVITSVNEQYVFVRYGADKGSKATDPRDLKWLSPR